MGLLQPFHHRLALLCAGLCLAGSAAAQGVIDFDPARLLGGLDAASRFYSRFSFSSVPFNHRWQDDLYTSNTPRTRYTLRLERGWAPQRGALRFNAGLAWHGSGAVTTYGDRYHHLSDAGLDPLSQLTEPGLTPYLGLHWTPGAQQRLDLNLDLGVARGEPGTGRDRPRLAPEPAAPRDRAGLDLLGLTPILSIGLRYSF